MKIENDRGKKESNSNSLGVIAMIISGVALVCCLCDTCLCSKHWSIVRLLSIYFN